MRAFKKTFRRLPCGFLRALSTGKAAFPQVFLGFLAFLSYFWLFLWIFSGFGAICVHRRPRRQRLQAGFSLEE